MKSIQSRPFHCLVLAAFVLAFFVSPAAAVDILLRSTGQIDFASDPIPADFFGPGSLPFTGVALLTGVPIGPFGADTIVSRGAVVGGLETVPIELVALHLQSAAPIQVDFSGGPSSFFDIFVELEPSTPATGAMQLQQTSPSGGVIQGSHFENVDIVIGSLLPNLTIHEFPNFELLPPPRPYDFVGPPYYPGPPGFFPAPQSYNSGGLSLTMTPVPEPSTIVLAGCGLAILLVVARRTRRGSPVDGAT